MFFRLLGALVAADAIDRAARKPPKYWYPNHAQHAVSSIQPQHAPGPPAGWYPDPVEPGASRWWDGSRWTEHTAQRVVPVLEA